MHTVRVLNTDCEVKASTKQGEEKADTNYALCCIGSGTRHGFGIKEHSQK